MKFLISCNSNLISTTEECFIISTSVVFSYSVFFMNCLKFVAKRNSKHNLQGRVLWTTLTCVPIGSFLRDDWNVFGKVKHFNYIQINNLVKLGIIMLSNCLFCSFYLRSLNTSVKQKYHYNTLVLYF